MTETRMVKDLIEVSKKVGLNYGVFYLIDHWQVDSSKRVREVITVQNLIEEFTKKEGRFYNKYKITSDFRDLIKHISKKEEMQIDCFYKDTYEAFMEQWKKDHPNEESYEKYVEKQKKKREKEYRTLTATFGLYGSPCFSVFNHKGIKSF